MTTKTDELKPCPFCGCANIHITPDEVGSGGQWVGPVHVVCGGDCVAGQSGDDRESAIAAWNRRAALQSQDREDVKRPVLDSIVDEIHRRADKEWADDGYDFEVTITADEYKALCEEEKAIDHARRIEGDGE